MPSVQSRISDKMNPLCTKLEVQAKSLPVEVLVFLDNKQRTIGEKRDALVQIAKGDYVAFVDDDDDVTDDYVRVLVNAIKATSAKEPDVITFKQLSSINDDESFEVSFGLNNENEGAHQDGGVWKPIKRKPFHVCAWKRSLVKDYHFPALQYGEDWGWIEQFIDKAEVEHHIDRVLHYYFFHKDVTEAK